jgi:3-oxoacyl-[acyl-carrier-protein] synthase II
MNYEKVVVTGLGSVSPVGLSARETYAALISGRSGIQRLAYEPLRGASVRIGGLVAPEIWSWHGPDNIPRFAQFAWTAAREAVADAALLDAHYHPERIATILGTGFGGADMTENMCRELFDQGDPEAPRIRLDGTSTMKAAELVALAAGARGPCQVVGSACASAAHALGRALYLLRTGQVDAVVSGGAESTVTPLSLALFERLGALSKYKGDPKAASRPFDRDRDGFVMGEGSGILVLETEARARRRGAQIYGELAGFGASADAFHVTRPADDGAGMGSAIKAALRDARIDRCDVQYVNAHGTGTELNDVAETRALKRAFGEHAQKLWVSSNKSMIGHLLGAASAVESVVLLQTLMHGVVPPTLNLTSPDERCDLDYCPGDARERSVRVVAKTSLGFGGQNAALIFRAAA